MGFLNLNKCDSSSGISGSHDTSTIFTKYFDSEIYNAPNIYRVFFNELSVKFAVRLCFMLS